MNILVTGGAGFVGRYVVKNLLKSHKVVVLDNFSNSSHKYIQEFFVNKKFMFIQGDILDHEILKKSFNNVDLCVHLAAKVNVQESLEYPETYFKNNVVGTYNVLEACRKNDVRLIFCGTCMVYDLAGSELINEEYAIKPRSPYAGSKMAGEEMAISYHYGYGLPVTVVRPFNTYGPFQKSNAEGGVVSVFIKRYLEGRDLSIFGDGEQTRDLMYVEDCADFFDRVVKNTKGKGEILNAGTGNDIKIRDLALMICKDRSRIKNVAHPHPQSEISKLICDCSKAKKILGWYPNTSLKEGIEKTVAWMRKFEGAP